MNSQSFKAKGVELSLDATVARLRFAASYSHLDADVTQSLSSGALTPSFNPAFPGIPIGNFSPLKGQRPFRRPANTGNLLVSYSQGPATVAVSGYFAGKSNDSTFLGGCGHQFRELPAAAQRGPQSRVSEDGPQRVVRRPPEPQGLYDG